MFAPQIEHLTGLGFRVLTWDARGHGKTESSSPESFTYWDQAEDALAVLDAAGVDRAVVGGMSQGGYIALRLALLAPDRVRALVLLDTEAGASPEEQRAEYRSLFAAWCDESVALEPLAAGLSAQLIGGSQQQREPWLAKWAVSNRPAIAAAGRCLAERESVEPRLPEIACPALVLRGELDASSTAEKSAALAAGLPGAGDVVTIPAPAGHAANWTSPEPVNSAIERFLRSCGLLPATE